MLAPEQSPPTAKLPSFRACANSCAKEAYAAAVCVSSSAGAPAQPGRSGMSTRKRYQDVHALLDAGINVIAAFNVQHLESLNDLVTRVAGVAVRETVPDRFLKEADQVVNLDLAVEDLLQRLREGKIYSPDKIDWALGHCRLGRA